MTVSSLPVPRRGLAARGAVGLGTAVRATPIRLLTSVRRAPVIWSLCLLMVAVALLEHAVIGQVHGGRPIGLLSLGALPNFSVAGRGGSTDWWRYVSSVVLHVNLVHLAGTTVCLVIVGTRAELLYGRLATLGVFTVSAVAAGALWVSLGTDAPGMYTVGASGGICGLIGLMVSFGRKRLSREDRRLARAAASRALAATALLLLTGFLMDGVNNQAHVAALLCGFLVGAQVPPLPEHGGRRLRRAERAVLVLVLAGAALALVAAGVHLAGRLAQPG